MKRELNNILTEAIKARLMSDDTIAGYIMRVIGVGREAAYRRLRGEVPFTFEEVVILTKAMGISIDEMVGITTQKEAIFTLNIEPSQDPLDYLYNISNSYRDIYIYLKDGPNAVINSAFNCIPLVSHAHYEALTKFRIFRWLHAMHGVTDIDEVVIPEKLTKIFTDIFELQTQIPVSYTLWDQNVFRTLVKEIHYYIKMNVLSPESIKAIKEELLEIIDNAEELAFKGAYNNGNEVYLYISSILFDTSYTLLEKDAFQLSIFNMYTIDYIHSQHPEICKAQKQWIQSLIRYSTLISQCGEKQRLIFFKEQRELVNALT